MDEMHKDLTLTNNFSVLWKPCTGFYWNKGWWLIWVSPLGGFHHRAMDSQHIKAHCSWDNPLESWVPASPNTSYKMMAPFVSKSALLLEETKQHSSKYKNLSGGNKCNLKSLMEMITATSTKGDSPLIIQLLQCLLPRLTAPGNTQEFICQENKCKHAPPHTQNGAQGINAHRASEVCHLDQDQPRRDPVLQVVYVYLCELFLWHSWSVWLKLQSHYLCKHPSEKRDKDKNFMLSKSRLLTTVLLVYQWIWEGIQAHLLSWKLMSGAQVHFKLQIKLDWS